MPNDSPRNCSAAGNSGTSLLCNVVPTNTQPIGTIVAVLCVKIGIVFAPSRISASVSQAVVLGTTRKPRPFFIHDTSFGN